MARYRHNSLIKQLLLIAALALCAAQVSAAQHLHEQADSVCGVCLVGDDLQAVAANPLAAKPPLTTVEPALPGQPVFAATRRGPSLPRAPPAPAN